MAASDGHMSLIFVHTSLRFAVAVRADCVCLPDRHWEHFSADDASALVRLLLVVFDRELVVVVYEEIASVALNAAHWDTASIQNTTIVQKTRRRYRQVVYHPIHVVILADSFHEESQISLRQSSICLVVSCASSAQNAASRIHLHPQLQFNMWWQRGCNVARQITDRARRSSHRFRLASRLPQRRTAKPGAGAKLTSKSAF